MTFNIYPTLFLQLFIAEYDVEKRLLFRRYFELLGVYLGTYNFEYSIALRKRSVRPCLLPNMGGWGQPQGVAILQYTNA